MELIENSCQECQLLSHFCLGVHSSCLQTTYLSYIAVTCYIITSNPLPTQHGFETKITIHNACEWTNVMRKNNVCIECVKKQE